jgi:hypothetical protein
VTVCRWIGPALLLLLLPVSALAEVRVVGAVYCKDGSAGDNVRVTAKYGSHQRSVETSSMGTFTLVLPRRAKDQNVELYAYFYPPPDTDTKSSPDNLGHRVKTFMLYSTKVLTKSDNATGETFQEFRVSEPIGLECSKPLVPPGVARDKDSKYDGTGGLSSVMAALFRVATAAGITAGAVPPCGDCIESVETFPAYAINVNTVGGDLLATSRSRSFRSLGFRYAPYRDTVGAIPTNPSASAFDEGWETSASFVRGVPTGSNRVFERPRFARLGVSRAWASRWSAGAGYYYQQQDGYLTSRFATDVERSPPIGTYTSDVSVHASDHAFTAFVARQLTASTAASAGLTWQSHRTCRCTITDATITRTTYTDGYISDAYHWHRDLTDVTQGALGVSAGFTWLPRADVRIGLAANNIGSANTLATQPRHDRSVGAGVNWTPARLNLGIDIEKSDILGVTASVGANYITSWHNLELRSGYVSGVNTANAGFTIWGFDYTAAYSSDPWVDTRDLPRRWRHYFGSHVNF